jgi:ribosomal protein S26
MFVAAFLVACALVGTVVWRRAREERRYQQDIEKILGEDGLQPDSPHMAESERRAWT